MDLDLETIRRAQKGDPLARAAFLRGCIRSIRALARKLADPQDVEDRVQELLTHLLEVLPQFDPRGPARPSTWVYTVAWRALLMQRRKRKLTVVPLEEASAVPDHRPTIDGELERAELHGRLQAAVNELSEPQRHIFVLAQLCEVPLQEIADAEGLPLGTVKSRLHRARAELVLKLGPLLDADKNGGGHVANG